MKLFLSAFISKVLITSPLLSVFLLPSNNWREEKVIQKIAQFDWLEQEQQKKTNRRK